MAVQKKSIPTSPAAVLSAAGAEIPDPVNSTTAGLAKKSNLFFAIGLVAILATLLIPLPTFLLDIGLACSISLAIAVLIIVLSTNQPVELSTFPSLLLITTLFRYGAFGAHDVSMTQQALVAYSLGLLNNALVIA